MKLLGEGEEDDECPVNIRTLVDFVPLQREGLKMKFYDGAKNDPQYVV